MRRPAPLAPLPRALLALAGTIAFALLAWWLDRRMLGVAREAYLGFTPIFANALPGLLAALLLVVLTRRPGFSLFVVAGVQVLVYRVSEVKLTVLGDPLGLQDLYFITSPSAESFELLGAYLERPWLLAAGAVLLGALAGVAWWLERPAFRAFRWTHAGLALAGIALCASLVTARQPWSGVYDKDALHPSRFKAISSILHAGLMSNLVYTHLQNRQAVDTLDEAALARLFDTVPVRPGQVAPAGQRPDVVVILSESLFDPRRIAQTDTFGDACAALAEPFNKLILSRARLDAGEALALSQGE